MICTTCLIELPYTGFHQMQNNRVEKLFWGRVSLQKAFSVFYYIPDTPLQRIVHHIKYKNGFDLGIYMGEIMGTSVAESTLFQTIDLCIPMPLHPKKEFARGYNQATALCKGIESITRIPYADSILYRTENSSTQTKKTRIERWENVAELFELRNPSAIDGKHILLVDDVITTGASMEACANVLIKNKAASVSVCSLAYTV